MTPPIHDPSWPLDFLGLYILCGTPFMTPRGPGTQTRGHIWGGREWQQFSLEHPMKKHNKYYCYAAMNPYVLSNPNEKCRRIHLPSNSNYIKNVSNTLKDTDGSLCHTLKNWFFYEKMRLILVRRCAFKKFGPQGLFFILFKWIHQAAMHNYGNGGKVGSRCRGK